MKLCNVANWAAVIFSSFQLRGQRCFPLFLPSFFFFVFFFVVNMPTRLFLHCVAVFESDSFKPLRPSNPGRQTQAHGVCSPGARTVRRSGVPPSPALVGLDVQACSDPCGIRQWDDGSAHCLGVRPWEPGDYLCDGTVLGLLGCRAGVKRAD